MEKNDLPLSKCLDFQSTFYEDVEGSAPICSSRSRCPSKLVVLTLFQVAMFDNTSTERY